MRGFLNALIDLSPWFLANLIAFGGGWLACSFWAGRRPSEAETWRAEPKSEVKATTSRKPLPQVLDDEYEADLEEREIDKEVR